METRMLWCLTAFAGPVYNNDEVTLAVGDARRVDLVALLREELPKVGAELDRPLKTMARSELLALIVAASSPERGGEFDLLLDEDRVTVWEGTTWRVQRSPGHPVAAPGPTMETLVTTYGLGPASVVGNATWEPAATAALEQALAVLTPAERARLAGVRWVRRARPVRDLASGTGLHAATYIVDGEDARIEVYDDAIIPTTRFVGPLERPSTPATAVILHEIGHAVADAPLLELNRAYERRRRAHAAAQTVLADDLAAHNRSVEAYNRQPDATAGQRLTQAATRLQAEAQRLNVLATELDAARRALEAGQRTSPMARLFAEEVGGTATVYARQSADEAFAEAFSLYHLDPDALERVQPGALAWFTTGRHVRPP